MVLNNGVTLAAHNASLSNQTGNPQTILTASFVNTHTDSVTTSKTHQTGISLTTTAEMRFPVAAGSVAIDVAYDFGVTNSVESTVTNQWTVPSQPSSSSKSYL